MQEEDLLGLTEVAATAGVTKQVVANWRHRDASFPAPVAELAAGPVFNSSQIRSYLARWRRKGLHMAHVISTINLKGGGRVTRCTAYSRMPSKRTPLNVRSIWHRHCSARRPPLRRPAATSTCCPPASISLMCRIG